MLVVSTSVYMLFPMEKFFPDRWLRFERYEIRDGYIRPIGTPRHYWPWEGFRAPERKKAIERPYGELVRLADSIPPGTTPSDSQLDEITHWCEQHGLLAILLHRCESVILPSDSKVYVAKYERETKGWRAVRTPDARFTCGAWMRDVGRFNSRFEPLSENWMRYFPDVSRPQNLPPPFSEPFWREYAEPVGGFLEAARFLTSAVSELRALRESKQNLEAKRASFEAWPERLIHALTANVRPMMTLQSPTRYADAWAGGSLLSDFAMMVHLDFTRGRVMVCASEDCGAVFVTNSIEAKYCSKKCRSTVQMRKHRQLLKGKKHGSL